MKPLRQFIVHIPQKFKDEIKLTEDEDVALKKSAAAVQGLVDLLAKLA